MPRKETKIKTQSFITIDGVLYEFKDLPPDLREQAQDRMLERMRNALGRYFSEHPEEIEPLIKSGSILSCEPVETV